MKKDSERGRYTRPDGSTTWEYICVISCASQMFCIGLMMGWSSPSLGILMGPDSPIPVTSSDASTLSSMPNVGQTLGAMLTILMADKFGRKKSLLAGGVPVLVNWLLTAITDQITVLFVARFIGGLSLGFNYSIVAMYVGEIASAKLRGVVGLVCGITFTMGAVSMYTIAPYLSIKMMAWLCLSIATVATLSVFIIPDSPYFLAMVGKIEEAEDALVKLRGKTDVEEELELIKLTVGQKGKVKASALKQLFAVSGNRKALAINFLFFIALSLGGYVLVMLYSSVIFERMNGGVEPHVCMMIIGAIQLACKLVVASVIDKLGRRPLILVSGLLSGSCLFIVSVYFFLMEYMNMDVSSYGLLALGAIFVNAIAINIGLLPLQIVVLSETLDTEVKVLANFLMGTGGGIIAALGAKAYLMLAVTWGHFVPFFGFVVITWSSTILILRLLPETKGKTLLDIQRDLNA